MGQFACALVALVALLGMNEAQGGGHERVHKTQLETPQYTTVHKESDFEVRLYRETVWASVIATDASFVAATAKGFHKLFQYIEGANLNWSHIPMTTPLLTGSNPSAGPFNSAAYVVRLYLASGFQAIPPTPLPELDLGFERWPEQCVAVRTFSGYAKDNNVAKEAGLLASSLNRSPWANATNGVSQAGGDSYAIAQYNSPFTFVGRVNEVWVSLSDSSLRYGCLPWASLVATAR